MNGERENILVVDEEESVRDLLQRILIEAGYNVITAADGNEALDKLSSGETKIVLLDIKMPGLSGIEILTKLYNSWPEYCVIMVTATVDTQTAIDVLKLGAFDFIIKPFKHEEAKGKVQDAISKWHHLTQEKQRYLQLTEKFTEHTHRMQDQFNELVSSLSREHKLMLELASKHPDGGKSLFSKLPTELQEPMSSVDKFRDALLRILRRT